MSYLNLGYSILVYDDVNDRNPKIREPDITQDLQQICVDHQKSERFTIYPNDVIDIAVTARALASNNTTELEFRRPLDGVSDNLRIIFTGTGSNPLFRTNRNLGGGATTAVAVSRVSPYVARITRTAGTAWTTGSILPGDWIKFETTTDDFTSPFATEYHGKKYLIQAKGTDHIDFVDNGELPITTSDIVLGADFAFALRAFSPGPVKIGDTIELSGAGLHPSNVGKFVINDLSTDYVQITSPYGVEETILVGTNSVVIYDRLIGFVHARGVASGPFKIRFGDSSEWITVDRIGPDAIFMGSVRTFRIQATNDGPDSVILSVNHATVI